jgi:FkbM family methyltransferase
VKDLIRRLFRIAGFEIYRRATCGRGISLELDLHRLWGRNKCLIVFDVGANTGQTIRRFHRAFPSAEIFAFEPAAIPFSQLVKNYGKSRAIHCLKLAAGDHDGRALMSIFPQSEWNRIVDERTEADLLLEHVDVTTLDSFCIKNDIPHIDLLKADCEGFELRVLNGAARILKEARVDCIYCEVDFERRGNHGDFFAIANYLAAHGFSLYGIYDYSSWRYNVIREGFANALFIRRTFLETRSQKPSNPMT